MCLAATDAVSPVALAGDLPQRVVRRSAMGLGRSARHLVGRLVIHKATVKPAAALVKLITPEANAKPVAASIKAV